MCVCVCVHTHILETIRRHSPDHFTKFVHMLPVARGSVLLWRRCITLHTSGFVDDVILHYSGLSMLCFKETTYYNFSAHQLILLILILAEMLLWNGDLLYHLS